MTSEDVRVRVVVSGRVQGVFFRASAAEEARRLGVRGWVRNVPGGSVEAVFEGSPGDVDSIVAWCRHGPEFAKVEACEVVEEPPAGETDFRIR